MTATRWTDAQAAEIERLYAEGRSQREIARICGTHQVAISRLMARYGMTTRPPCGKGEAGPAHHGWKGDGAHYKSLHSRVYRLRGQPSHCERCGTADPGKRYDWANLTGNYADPDDYVRMCRACHQRFDMARRLEGDLSVGEVASRIGIHPATVCKYIRRGLIAAERAGAISWRITESALADYLQRRAS